MLCCVLLAGLGLFGPRGVRLYRALRGRHRVSACGRRRPEVATSSHLVLSPRTSEENQ